MSLFSIPRQLVEVARQPRRPRPSRSPVVVRRTAEDRTPTPPRAPAERLVIEVLRGAAAEALLHGPRFRQRWDALHERCPWATIFQRSAFAITWYDAYRGAREPLLITAESSSGDLVGLLPLAVGADDGRLEAAGGHHAEYQSWLAVPEHQESFIVGALEELRRRFPRATLRFLFLAPGTPLEWTRRRDMSMWRETHCNSRGVMQLGDGSAIERSLRKKSNRSRWQRLSRLGEVRFEQVTSVAGLDAELERIAAFCDLRQGAVHGALPFCADPRKRELYRRMMEVPGLLHVTVLRVGNELAAAHIGMCDGTRVVLGLLVHSPLLAAHSPGKLHLLLLARMLREQGFTALDLTPGGEYKERFANAHEPVQVLTLFARRRDRLRHRLVRGGVRTVRGVLRACRVDAERALERGSAWWERLRVLTPRNALPKVLRRARRTLWWGAEARIDLLPASRVGGLRSEGVLAKDDIGALLAYRATGSMPPLRVFLREALGRLEAGQHVFTVVRDGLLVHYVWMIERQERAQLAVVDGELSLPADTAVVFDAMTHPSARGKGLYRAALAEVSRAAAAVPGTRYVCTCHLTDVGASRHLLTEFGFIYQGSFFKTIRLGRARRWAAMPTEWPMRIVDETAPPA